MRKDHNGEGHFDFKEMWAEEWRDKSGSCAFEILPMTAWLSIPLLNALCTGWATGLVLFCHSFIEPHCVQTTSTTFIPTMVRTTEVRYYLRRG
jgi:hypothetical protein